MLIKHRSKNPLQNSEYIKHETKKSSLIKFLLLVSVFLLYLGFVSYHYGLKNGISTTVLTWSFFVLSTPIADAGFLIDFPVRLILKIRMIYSEILVWIIAISTNIYTISTHPDTYQNTEVLKLFHHILVNPYPFWLIIILSATGTFISIYFGDELIDVAKHKHRKKYNKHRKKYTFLIIIFLFVATFLLYKYLLNKIGINI